MISAAYNALADEYDDAYSSSLCKAEEMFVADTLKGRIEDASSMLDLGCGTGLALDMFGHFGGPRPYAGVDVSAKMLRCAATRAARIGLHAVDLYETEMLEFLDQWGEAQFGCVISLFGSPNYVHWETLCEGAFKVVKPGGWVALMPFAKARYMRPAIIPATAQAHSMQRDRAVAGMLCAGFERCEVLPVGCPALDALHDLLTEDTLLSALHDISTWESRSVAPRDWPIYLLVAGQKPL